MRKKTERVKPYKRRIGGRTVHVKSFKRKPKPKRRTGRHKGFKIRYANEQDEIFGRHTRYIDDQGRLL